MHSHSVRNQTEVASGETTGLAASLSEVQREQALRVLARIIARVFAGDIEPKEKVVGEADAGIASRPGED